MTDILYQLDRVSHFYGEKKVLDINRLAIPAGSILGLSGPNGSGKSTLLKLLAFAMAPTRGEIRFNNRVEKPMSPNVRSRVTLLTQKPYLLKRSVFDNVVYGLKVRKDTRDLDRRAAAALAEVGLDFREFKDRFWHELSGGEAQRVAMAARLILRPQALLLDEPVASVDTESARLIRRASLKARDEWGCTLVIVSHDLVWLNRCSDTRIAMAKGRIFSPRDEAVIPPPYSEQDGRTIKEIDGHPPIRLSPRSGATAVIGQENIRLSPDSEPGDTQSNSMDARVIQMILEQKTGNILTTLTIDGFSITLSLPPDQVPSLGLKPGNTVVLSFRPGDISWR